MEVFDREKGVTLLGITTEKEERNAQETVGKRERWY